MIPASKRLMQFCLLSISAWFYRITDAFQQHKSSQSYEKAILEKAGGALYRQSILTNEEYTTIRKEVSMLMNRLNEETASSAATKRQGASLSPNSETVKILKEGSLHQFVQKVTGNPSMNLSSNLPVEVRLYERIGASMAWHEDDVMYDPPQVEAVLTIENNSNCITMWKDGNQLMSKETDPNSVLLLRAGGPLHCVTGLKRGRRIILKCAYAESDAVFRDGILIREGGNHHQFGAVKGNKKPKKRKSKSKR